MCVRVSWLFIASLKDLQMYHVQMIDSSFQCKELSISTDRSKEKMWYMYSACNTALPLMCEGVTERQKLLFVV